MSQTNSALRFESLEAFDAWEDQQPDVWELHDGVPVLMPPERVDHTRIKYRVWAELDRAVRAAGVPCEVIGDGLTVPGPGLRSFRPDVTVMCGTRLGGNETKGHAPAVLVEVLSPSTARSDTGIKLESYFALPSVQHYAIVDSFERRVVLHSRMEDGRLLTTIVRGGLVSFQPPGLTVSTDAFYVGTDLDGPTG